VHADREELLALHDQIGQDNLRLRFFTPSRAAGHAYVEHVLEGQQSGEVLALGLWHRGVLVGLATAEGMTRASAEVAFLVADAYHGKGVGTLLLEHLAAAARLVGVRRFTADVLVDNAAMLRVFTDAGFEATRHHDTGVVTVEMQTALSGSALRAADRRESAAEAASLSALLHPGRVGVVGVRRDGTGVGATILDAIIEGAFAGDVVAIHPSTDVPRDIPSYRCFADVPGVVDLAVVAVPPTQVAGSLEEAGRSGVRAAVVVTSGFAEMGAAGTALQHQLTRVARAHDIRVVGPNCLGLLDNQPEVRLDATFAGAIPPPGGLALASQSGGVGIVVLDLARRLGLGVRHFVSLGNKADVSSNDLLAAWQDDPEVTAAALYLESFGNSAKFARIARRFAERKPLLAVVGGRSGSGQRAGASHTAAAATPAIRVDALFAQAGVIGCADAEDLAQTALLLSNQPLPAGSRLAVIGNAGGLGVLAADAATAAGLSVPILSEALAARLAPHVSGTTGTANPVDAGAAGSAAALGRLTAELLNSDEVDTVLVVVVRTRTLDPAEVLETLADARNGHSPKTAVAVLLGDIAPQSMPGWSILPSVDAAVRALRHAVRYAEWLNVPREEPPTPDLARAEAARSWATARIQHSGPGWLDPVEARALLGRYGLTPSGTTVHGVPEAVEAARATGFPVALKVADPDVVHKTDRGLVRIGVASETEVVRAVAGFAAELGRRDVPVLVQPMVRGVEVALGIVRDPGLGPLVMIAAGGTATELWDDRALLLAPVSAGDADRALRSLRIWPLLAGYRGAAMVDTADVVERIVSLGQLAADVPEVAEADLNPVVVAPEGSELVDVKLRLATSAEVDRGVPRRLRSPG